MMKQVKFKSNKDALTHFLKNEYLIAKNIKPKKRSEAHIALFGKQ